MALLHYFSWFRKGFGVEIVACRDMGSEVPRMTLNIADDAGIILVVCSLFLKLDMTNGDL